MTAGGDPADPAPVVAVRDLDVSYGPRPALRSVTFDCTPGEVVGVVGPNGAGKSTLLKTLVGLLRPSAGSVRIGGLTPEASRRHSAYLPQHSSVDWDFPATVRGLVAMGRVPALSRLRRPGRHDQALVDDALERLGLTDLARRPIGELSGGQRQRALLARALAQEARLLLLDEPFSGIDAVTERLLWRELGRARQEGRTVLVVNHDLAITAGRFDRVLLLAGRLVATGPPAEVLTPPNVLTAYGATPVIAGEA